MSRCCITHGNLYSSMQAMVASAELDVETDVLVSWLPLFHGMGMVGCITVPMAIGLEVVKVTPADFLARPLLWPELISSYGGTVTAAPNFAYAIVGKRMARADDAFDVSSLRFALNGAEPIDSDAARTFTDAGAPCRDWKPRSSTTPATGSGSGKSENCASAGMR